MNWLDIVILVVMAAALFLGFKIGIIKAFLSVAGLLAAIFLAGRFYIPLSERLSFISQARVAEVLAFIIILIGVMLVTSLVAVFLTWVTSAVMLGWINRLGGAVAGLVLGALLAGALLATWVTFFGMAEIVNKSGLALMLLNAFSLVLALLPDEFNAIRSFFR